MDKLLLIKNWITLIKNRGALTEEEIKSFASELLKLMEYIEGIETRLKTLEDSRDRIHAIKESAKSSEYIQSVLARIDILKNLMKKSVPEDSLLFSPKLVLVESIESDIKEYNSVTSHQLETLNDLYQDYRKMLSKI